jgi:hypothetical protein
MTERDNSHAQVLVPPAVYHAKPAKADLTRVQGQLLEGCKVLCTDTVTGTGTG